MVVNGRSKNDKNWENWERIREQKLEKMKSICFESYRQSKKEKYLQSKPKPKSLDPSWYTDNIYSNRSEDLEEDYIPECIKYGTHRPLRNIREQDEFYEAQEDTVAAEMNPFGGGLQRSTSCRDFKYPKSKSCCFSGSASYEEKSSAKVMPTVPKSYSFSAGTSKTTPFDVMDYEPPPPLRKEKKLIHKPMDCCCMEAHATCCARERCTSSKCLLEEIYNCNRRTANHERCGRGFGALYSGAYGSGGVASAGSKRNLIAEWEERNRRPNMRYPMQITCCANSGEYCYQHQQQHLVTIPPARRLMTCQVHPAAEEEEHIHCRADPYDTNLDHFIRDERERLMMQDKFLDEDEQYLTAAPPRNRPISHQRSYHRKSMLEMQPPSRYDDDTCSDSTEMDLEDFNIDLEKYWEELEKPPSPIDLDMQRRNMRSNLKVKNVNVGCYNNGQPIDIHDREQERMMIKKSLLEGMPSPPSTSQQPPNNQFHFFEHAGSPFHRFSQKVYPEQPNIPTYKYNNFYTEHDDDGHMPVDSHHDNHLFDDHSQNRHYHYHNQPNCGAAGNSALSLINNIFSIYKPNKYSPLNCQLNETKPEPCKKMNVPSTRRPLGAPHSEYMHSMKRPLIVSTEQPHFKIIPEKTGLKISPLYQFEVGDKQTKHKLTSTARPLMFPH